MKDDYEDKTPGTTNQHHPCHPCSDDQIDKLLKSVNELKGISRELNGMIHTKIDALLGSNPATPPGDPDKNQPNGLIDELSLDVSETIRICRDSLERMAGV